MSSVPVRRVLVLLLAVLASTLTVVGPPAAAEPAVGSMMSFFPTAVLTGQRTSATVTTRGAYSDPGGTLTLTPTAPATGAPVTGTVVAGSTSGSRWVATLDLTDRSGLPYASGLYDAVLTLPSGTETCSGCFTLLTATAPGVKTSLDLAPRRAERGESELAFTAAGQSFVDGTVVEVLLRPASGKAVLDPAVQFTGSGGTGGVLTRTVSVLPEALLGYRDVRFTNPDGRTTTCVSCFTVTAPSEKVEPTGVTNDVAREVHVHVPTVLPADAELVLFWAGQGAPNPALDLKPKPRTTKVASGVTSVLTGTIDFTGATPGANLYHAGYVLRDGSKHDCLGLCRFTVRQVAPPVLRAVNGLTAPGATKTLTLTGTGFTPGTLVTTDQSDVVVKTISWKSTTSMTVVVQVADTAGTAPVTFTVRNPDEQSSVHDAGFVEPPAPGPPVPAVADPDTDPDPSRAPEAPSIRLSSRSIAVQQPVQVTGRAVPGTTLDLFARTAPAEEAGLLRSLVVPDSGAYAFTVSPQANTRLSVVSRNSYGRTSSSPLDLQVRSAVRILPGAAVRRVVRFAGSVQPRRTGQRVSFWFLRKGQPFSLDCAVATTSTGSFVRSCRFPAAGTYVVFARTSADTRNAAGVSGQTTIRVP